MKYYHSSNWKNAIKEKRYLSNRLFLVIVNKCQFVYTLDDRVKVELIGILK